MSVDQKFYQVKEVKEALKTVRTWLETKQIKARDFNMELVLKNYCTSKHCGTVGCIGGWVTVALRAYEPKTLKGMRVDTYRITSEETFGEQDAFHDILELTQDENFNARCEKLFYPQPWVSKEAGNSGTWKFSREQGIQAIDNFLKGRKDPWKNIDGVYPAK